MRIRDLLGGTYQINKDLKDWLDFLRLFDEDLRVDLLEHADLLLEILKEIFWEDFVLIAHFLFVFFVVKKLLLLLFFFFVLFLLDFFAESII
jgi:hypothetical protein